ncbi:MAG: protein kinase [Planctomycetales bacterium]|nr:protein kinase [Planctomycetales bacterium]NIM09098.1 protein kinase [Planctomycetales bacterium]NIN08558.1 protein kinase [Planctomycetales bacterium]NIN77691.1 protein kinase [Planctomycetales bacterium]NIO34856.1 protein kinase [Planctomycetales bacterium]
MLKTRQKLGKYQIERKLGEGGFALVYQARDTIEGVRVALKIPYPHLVTPDTLEDFRHEVRVAARLEHPHILPLKNAEFINGHFVITTALGQGTLADRLQKRLSFATALDFAEQMLAAVAYAHENRIIHCDIKPDNFLLFPGNRLRLTDFGIARVAQKTIKASGEGTVGYIAPEQAMGKPSFASDVFSLGLILYRMFSGQLPDWPYDWPPVGYDRLRRRLHPEMLGVVRKAVQVDVRRRYRNAGQMLAAFGRAKPRAIRFAASRYGQAKPKTTRRDWQAIRRQEFVRQFGKLLEARFACSACQGPVSEPMTCCPWCGKARRKHDAETRFPIHCPRCHRGMKLDWRYCAWCYGPGFEVQGNRAYSDVRYTARCENERCERKKLMPFMRYCPWCHTRVRRTWNITGSQEKCARCDWGVLRAFWSYCPWCSKKL